MYNHYLYDDRDAFEDLYVDVSAPEPEAPEPEPPKPDAPPPDDQPAPKAQQHGGGGGLSALLARFGRGENNLTSLLILAFLMLDAEEDERMIILALALLLGL